MTRPPPPPDSDSDESDEPEPPFIDDDIWDPIDDDIMPDLWPQ